MNIQVSTDNHIIGSNELTNHLQTSLSNQLKRFEAAITRIEVHLSESKAGKRCQIEARISNRPPVVIGHDAETLHGAIKAAVDKIQRSLESMVGKMGDRKSSKELFKELPPENETE